MRLPKTNIQVRLVAGLRANIAKNIRRGKKFKIQTFENKYV